MPSSLPFAITMGDAAGIGPEIIARYWQQYAPRDLLVIGDPGQIIRAIRLISADIEVSIIKSPEEAHSLPGIPVISAGRLPEDLPYGRIDRRAGAVAYDSIIEAIHFAKTRRIAGMITAPIHKEALYAAGIRFPGHTEILAAETGTSDFAMMLAEGNLRVILNSIHLSLRAALDMVTIENELKTIRLAAQACAALGIANPRIAVAGLNPHAGEGGLFGHEDRDIIAPAIARAQAEGLDVSGPLPPDTVFMQAKKGRFDIVVAQYHDQGLIPVKLGGIETGVNITIGLPIIRTSVDHGTAFDIAGKGIADASSLAEAVSAARMMAKVRFGG